MGPTRVPVIPPICIFVYKYYCYVYTILYVLCKIPLSDELLGIELNRKFSVPSVKLVVSISSLIPNRFTSLNEFQWAHWNTLQ